MNDVEANDPLAVSRIANDSGRPRGRSFRVSISYLGLLVGLAVFTALLAYHGVAEVAAALAVAGWGLLAIAACHLTSLVADAVGWRRLIDERERPSLASALFARWTGESVNGLLPVMQLGGNVVRAIALTRRGVASALAGASVVVDVTLEAVTQIAFTLIGIALLGARLGADQIITAAAVVTGLMGLLVAAFVLLQRAGFFGAAVRALGRVGAAGAWSSLGEGAAALDERITALYADRRALVASSAWHLLGWLLGVGEVWLALRFLGSPVGLASALVLESLGAAVRGAAFAVPGAIGVQEGGFLVLGGVLGLDAHTCLALSLSKRARELLLGLPGLVAWQIDRTRPAARGGAHVRA